MISVPAMRPETRYGMPGGADQLLFNRHYCVGYSFLFRQARWAMERIDTSSQLVETDRGDSFRVDPRVPQKFRSELCDYHGSGYDRGHLISSADRLHSDVANSETFLLSNMSPQVGVGFNRGVWRNLEQATREIAAMREIVEVYVVTGPVFYLNKPVTAIGNTPVPHAFFKSVLQETIRGRLHHETFLIPNEATSKTHMDFVVSTEVVESLTGLELWDRIRDPDFVAAKR